MSETTAGPPAPQTEASRFAKLEARIGALEKLMATATEATEFKLRNLKRDIGTISRSVAQRSTGTAGGRE